MNKSLISKASKKLELLNIVLHNSSLERCDLDPFLYPDTVEQQSMLSISSEEASYSNEDDDFSLFRSYVNFGIRALKVNSEESEEPEILFTLEATFRVDYMLSEELTNEEAEEFSKFNSVHNSWPFWRRHVFDVVQQADLPKLMVPLMRGMAIKSASKKKAKKTTKKKAK